MGANAFNAKSSTRREEKMKKKKDLPVIDVDYLATCMLGYNLCKLRAFKGKGRES